MHTYIYTGIYVYIQLIPCNSPSCRFTSQYSTTNNSPSASASPPPATTSSSSSTMDSTARCDHPFSPPPSGGHA